jgi:hypothetical protein
MTFLSWAAGSVGSTLTGWSFELRQTREQVASNPMPHTLVFIIDKPQRIDKRETRKVSEVWPSNTNGKKANHID